MRSALDERLVEKTLRERQFAPAPAVHGLTTHQIALHMRTAARPRRTVKWCKTCGGTHAGHCNLVATSHGTRCRPAIVDRVERLFRDRAGL